MELGPTLACLEAQLWPPGPRIGSFDGATVGICRGHPGSICLFCCRLQPARGLVIGQSSLWTCCFGDAALPAACLASIFRLLQLQLPCARFGPAWLRSPRPGFSSNMRPHPRALALVHTCSSSPSYRVGWHLFACREPRTECEVVSFPPSLVHWSNRSICCSCDLRCQVPAWAVWLPVSLCLSFSTIILLHTCCAHFAAANRPILFVFRVVSLSRTLSSACRSIPFPLEHRGGRRTDRGDRQTNTLVDPSCAVV